MKTLVLMPTFNEIDTLQNSVKTLFEHNPALDLLVIDDNSPDGTGALADTMAAEDSRIFVLHRISKQGLGRAYIDGFHWGIEAGYELLIQMDADGSHQPKDLPRILRAAETADLVIGSRWISGGEVQNWPLIRQLISRFGNLYARVMLGSTIQDLTAGFRAYRSTLLGKIDLKRIQAQGYGFQAEMTLRSLDANSRVVEVPISFIERENGRSKMTWAIIIEAYLLCTKWGLQRLIRR